VRPNLSHLPHDLPSYLVRPYDRLIAHAAEDARRDVTRDRVCDADTLAEQADARARALGIPGPELEPKLVPSVLRRLLGKFGHRVDRYAELPPDRAAEAYVFAYMAAVSALMKSAPRGRGRST
jgi:hypothetical protein